MDCRDQLLVQLEEWLAAGEYDEALGVRPALPGTGDCACEFFSRLEPAAARTVRAHEISVAELAERVSAVVLSPVPEIAPCGYAQEPVAYLQRTFEEVEGYDEMIVLRDIGFISHCEHHLAPIIGKAHVGYIPAHRVVGISKLARVVDVYARRLQVQEKMTAQIAKCVQDVLQPEGAAVVIEARHQCMTTRGVHKPDVVMVTSQLLGAFRTDPSTRREFLAMIGNPSISMAG